MDQDPYDGFAGRYDHFHGEFGQHDSAEASFFQGLFDRYQVRTVLDCACGTGQHLHLFHTQGYEVVGSDLSVSMLAQARENLAASGVQVPVLRADYRGLPQVYHERFGAVVCLSSSLLHMPDDEQVLKALRSMRAVLRPGGILVLTQGTTDRQWKEKPRFILGVDTSELTRLFVIDYLGMGARYHIVDIEHGVEKGDLKAWSIEYPRILLRADQDRLLLEAGFKQMVFYGSFQFEPYDEERSQRLIAVAERGPAAGV